MNEFQHDGLRALGKVHVYYDLLQSICLGWIPVVLYHMILYHFIW